MRNTSKAKNVSKVGTMRSDNLLNSSFNCYNKYGVEVS